MLQFFSIYDHILEHSILEICLEVVDVHAAISCVSGMRQNMTACGVYVSPHIDILLQGSVFPGRGHAYRIHRSPSKQAHAHAASHTRKHTHCSHSHTHSHTLLHTCTHTHTSCSSPTHRETKDHIRVRRTPLLVSRFFRPFSLALSKRVGLFPLLTHLSPWT